MEGLGACLTPPPPGCASIFQSKMIAEGIIIISSHDFFSSHNRESFKFVVTAEIKRILLSKISYILEMYKRFFFFNIYIFKMHKRFFQNALCFFVPKDVVGVGNAVLTLKFNLTLFVSQLKNYLL